MKESNVSDLTKALAVVSLLAPATGQPLSIGDIELHSALNQNLNAEIRLRLDQGENPSDVTVRMAPPEKFDAAGIPWSFFLSKIKFNTIPQADGSLVLKLTSKETLTEPFLDFLLEVSWLQGNQFREFTLLIDPPPSYNQPVNPLAENAAFSSETVEIPVRKPRSTAGAGKHSASSVNDIGLGTATSGEYGPTQPSSTLWRIASN